MTYLDTHGKGELYNCYEPSPWSQISAAQTQWCLGNYLLFKNSATDSHSWVMMEGEKVAGNPDLGYVIDQICLKPEYFADLGTPISAVHDYGGVYVRWYAQGLVLVNPGPSPAPIPVSLDGYKSVEQGSGGVILSPMGQDTAYVLIGNSVPYPQLPTGYQPPALCG